MELTTPFFNLILILPPENIAMLVFLVLLTSISYMYMSRFRKDRTTKLGNYETLKEVHGHKTSSSPAVLGVKVLIVTLLFMTATDSIRVETHHPVTDTDFAMVVDSSQTMETPDYPGNRLEYSKSRMADAVRTLPGKASISVLSFAGGVKTVSTATRDKDETIKAIESIKTDLSDPGTSLAPAIIDGVEILSGSNQSKRLIVVTDGENTGEVNMSTAVDKAVENSVELHFLAISQTEETRQLYQELREDINNSDISDTLQANEINKEKLQSAASRTGGAYYSLSSPEIFESSVQDIVTRDRKLGLNSDYIILIFISLLVIAEVWIYSKYGAI